METQDGAQGPPALLGAAAGAAVPQRVVQRHVLRGGGLHLRLQGAAAALPRQQPAAGRGAAAALPGHRGHPHLLRLQGQPVPAEGAARRQPGPHRAGGRDGGLLPAAADLRPAPGGHPQRHPPALLRRGAAAGCPGAALLLQR